MFFPFSVERLNTKIISHGHKMLTNSLWTYFMLNKEFEKATTIVKDLENEKFLQYRHLLSDIRLKNNIEAAYKFIEILPGFKKINQSTTLGLIYSALIDSYGELRRI